MAAPLLVRGIPVLRQRGGLTAVRYNSTWSVFSSLFKPTPPTPTPQDNTISSEGNRIDSTSTSTATAFGLDNTPLKVSRWEDTPEYRQWKDREAEILGEIEPIILRTKQILHTDRYMDGECLSDEDEQLVIENLLAYHPHSEDKVGCGLDSIMVDRHPQFKRSRCLFVVRTDGSWIDFSYQKCLRSYIREKYPSHAERFIREHYKRGSG